MENLFAIWIIFVILFLIAACLVSSCCANMRYNRMHGTSYSYWQCMWSRAYCFGYNPNPPVVAQASPGGIQPYQYNPGQTIVVTSTQPQYGQQPYGSPTVAPMMNPPPMNPGYGYPQQPQPAYGYGQQPQVPQPTQVYVGQPSFPNQPIQTFSPHQPQPYYYR